MESPGNRLRAAIARGTLRIPGSFNALTARIAARLGFPAVYLSGGALSAGWAGVPDVGLLTLTEFVEQAAVLTRAVDIPVISDADTGFGEAINVARAVRLFEEAGVAAIHLEDQELPKRCGHLSGKQLVAPDRMVEKIRAARGSTRNDLLIIARTDARSVEGFDAAVARAKLYLEAGAEMIFPEALESEAEFARFADEVDAPLIANMTEFGKSPLLSYDVFVRMGYAAVLYPMTAFRAAMHAAESALSAILEHGDQRTILDRLMTRAELYDHIDYREWEEADRRYFGDSTRPS